MDVQILSTILSGIFAVAAALGSVLLKEYFDRRRAAQQPANQSDENPYASPADAEPSAPRPQAPLEKGRPQRRAPSLALSLGIVAGGVLVGAGSRLLRPYANIGGTHYETLSAFAILGVACVALVGHNRNSPGLPGHLRYQLENAALWLGFACGWSLVHGYFWGDLVAVSSAWWLACALLGSIVLAIVHWSRRAAAQPG